MSMGNPKKKYENFEQNLEISDFFAFMLSCFDVIRLSATDKDFRVPLGAGKHARARWKPPNLDNWIKVC